MGRIAADWPQARGNRTPAGTRARRRPWRHGHGARRPSSAHDPVHERERPEIPDMRDLLNIGMAVCPDAEATGQISSSRRFPRSPPVMESQMNPT